MFWIAGLLAVLGALGVIVAKTPVHSVISLILNFVALAAIYLSLHAEFIAVIQVIIYAGAIMVLFLFVVALLTVSKDPVERPIDRLIGHKHLALVTAIGGGLLLAAVIIGGRPRAFGPAELLDESFGGAARFGEVLLKSHLFPFELTAFVLLAAVIGVVVLVGRRES